MQREVNTESEYRPYFVVKLQDGTTEDYPIGMVILRSSKDDKDLRDADRESDPDDRDDRDGDRDRERDRDRDRERDRDRDRDRDHVEILPRIGCQHV